MQEKISRGLTKADTVQVTDGLHIESFIHCQLFREEGVTMYFWVCNRHFDRACSKCSLCRYVCINLVETDRRMGMCHRWALSGSRHDADQCLCEELQQLDSTQSHSTPTPVYYSAAGLCGFHKNVCAKGPLHSDVRSEH